MRLFIDQMGQEVEVPDRPQRIISLVPSQTELLFDLGLEKEIVGVTKFCIHPASKSKNKIIVGGTKNFRFDTIDALKPDLIIGNKEENYELGINQLKKKYPVWISDICTLHDSMEMIKQIGRLVHKEKQAGLIVGRVSQSFDELQEIRKSKALYFIWNDPKMVAGRNTFIDHMLNLCGFENAVNINRYPELSDEEIEKLSPEFILLSSEPFPFKNKHIEEYKRRFRVEVRIVDGELFSWYGSRLLKSATYFKKLRLDLGLPS